MRGEGERDVGGAGDGAGAGAGGGGRAGVGEARVELGAGGADGQASIELVALLPLLLAFVLLLAQLLLAGMSGWLATTAARDAARASALGTDPRAAASASLPAPFRHGLSVRAEASGLHIRLRIPTLTGIPLGSLSATASMEPQR